jgi:sigma-B regulation protein RsbU (phosphoserine phosphatase)
LAGSAFAQYVDLDDSMLFARVGFEDSWTRTLPKVDDELWSVVAPARGGRSLVIRDLGLPGVPEGGPFSFLPGPVMEFTILLPFQADLTLINASDPALFLNHVGQEWAVYLNGVLLRNEFVRSGSGSGYVERSLRDVVVPLDKRRLVRGENLLAFRLKGDPVDYETGFDRSGPYVIDSYRALASGNSEYLDLMLIGVYAFFALYHCVLFALRPKDKGYLFFGAVTLLLASYMTCRTNIATSLVTDTDLLRRVEYVSLFLSLPALLAFLESLLRLGRSKFVIAATASCVALAVAGQFLRLEPLLIIWFGAASVSVVYAVVFSLGKALARDYRELSGKAAGRRLPALIFHSDSGRVAIGIAVMAVAVALDAISGGMAVSSMTWSKYAFFFFTLLTSSVLAGQFAKVSARAESMNAGLEAEVEEQTAELSAAASESVRLNEELSSANARLIASMGESEREVQIATSVQKGFFPTKPPAATDWDLSYVFEPAAGVSGDFYDYYEKDGSLTGVAIGSVSGSGIASGLVTVLAKNVFSRVLAETFEEPIGAALVAVNRALVRELAAVGNTVSGTFLRIRGPRVEYVSAAHTDAVLRREGRRDVSLVKAKDERSRTPPLGRDDFDAGVGALGFSAARGDAILVYTAGLVSSVNARREPYGVERLAEAFGRADPENAESMLASVMIDYRNFLSGARRSGDIAAIVLVKR